MEMGLAGKLLTFGGIALLVGFIVLYHLLLDRRSGRGRKAPAPGPRVIVGEARLPVMAPEAAAPDPGGKTPTAPRKVA